MARAGRNRVDAVLKAADNWVAALEALVAAKQASDETGAEQEAVDIAGSLLVAAIKNWRSGTRTSIPAKPARRAKRNLH
jgi:hypothetical protein